MTSNDNLPSAEEDSARVFHGIPSDEWLQSISYVELSALLVSCQKDSAKFHVVEAEKRRRDYHLSPAKMEIVVAQEDTDKDKKPSPDHWYKKPLPAIFLTVVAGSILLGIRYALIHHFGVPL